MFHRPDVQEELNFGSSFNGVDLSGEAVSRCSETTIESPQALECQNPETALDVPLVLIISCDISVV
jgi:hypothetical protein